MKARVTGVLSKEYTQGKKDAAQDILVVLAYILAQRGWKRKTIINILEKVKSVFDVINTGFNTTDNIAQILDEKYDIKMIKNSAAGR